MRTKGLVAVGLLIAALGLGLGVLAGWVAWGDSGGSEITEQVRCVDLLVGGKNQQNPACAGVRESLIRKGCATSGTRSVRFTTIYTTPEGAEYYCVTNMKSC